MPSKYTGEYEDESEYILEDTDAQKLTKVREILKGAVRYWTPEMVASQATKMLDQIAKVVGKGEYD